MSIHDVTLYVGADDATLSETPDTERATTVMDTGIERQLWSRTPYRVPFWEGDESNNWTEVPAHWETPNEGDSNPYVGTSLQVYDASDNLLANLIAPDLMPDASPDEYDIAWVQAGWVAPSSFPAWWDISNWGRPADDSAPASAWPELDPTDRSFGYRDVTLPITIAAPPAGTGTSGALGWQDGVWILPEGGYLRWHAMLAPTYTGRVPHDFTWRYPSRYLPPQTLNIVWRLALDENRSALIPRSGTYSTDVLGYTDETETTTRLVGDFDTYRLRAKFSATEADTTRIDGVVYADTLEEAMAYPPQYYDLTFDLYSVSESIGGNGIPSALSGSGVVSSINPISGVGTETLAGYGSIGNGTIEKFSIVFSLVSNNEAISGTGNMSLTGRASIGKTNINISMISGIGSLSISGRGQVLPADYIAHVIGTGSMVLFGAGLIGSNVEQGDILHWTITDGESGDVWIEKKAQQVSWTHREVTGIIWKEE